MGDVNFYLKKPKGGEPTLIFLKFKYNGQKPLVFSFGQKIAPANWDPEKQRVKSKLQTTSNGKKKLNTLLNELQTECESVYNNELAKGGYPGQEKLKKHLTAFMQRSLNENTGNPNLLELFEKFAKGVIGKSQNEGTWRVYDAVLKHLLSFQKDKKYKVSYETINMDFFYAYKNYVEKDLKLAHNTISKDFRVIKMVMNQAMEFGYTKNEQFRAKNFSYPPKEVHGVYLKEDELITLFELDLTGDKRFERVRDQFLFGCYTGLRFSDFNKITADNFFNSEDGLMIRVLTKKREHYVEIPCSPFAKHIAEKYEYNIPSRDISDLNKEIKKICKKAKFNETGRLRSDLTKPLWKCVSSHTCRRSFATNYYKAGRSVNLIMKITGHKTQASFFKYIKIDQSEAARQFSQENKELYNIESEYLLRRNVPVNNATMIPSGPHIGGAK